MRIRNINTFEVFIIETVTTDPDHLYINGSKYTINWDNKEFKFLTEDGIVVEFGYDPIDEGWMVYCDEVSDSTRTIRFLDENGQFLSAPEPAEKYATMPYLYGRDWGKGIMITRLVTPKQEYDTVEP